MHKSIRDQTQEVDAKMIQEANKKNTLEEQENSPKMKKGSQDGLQKVRVH